MECHKTFFVHSTDSACHGSDDSLFLWIVRIAVASKNPNNVMFLIALGDPFSIDFSIFLIENGIVVFPPAAPSGQQAHIHAFCICIFDNIIYMIPIVIVVTVLCGRPCGVALYKRLVAVSVRHIHTIYFRKSHSLDDVITFSGTVVQIFIRLLAIKAMK